jgi:hypothetical protein
MGGSLVTTWEALTAVLLRPFRAVLSQQPAMAGTARASFFRPSGHFTSRLSQAAHASSRPGTGFRMTGLSKTEAEDLLDWLEAHGQTGHLSFVAGEGFTVS